MIILKILGYIGLYLLLLVTANVLPSLIAQGWHEGKHKAMQKIKKMEEK